MAQNCIPADFLLSSYRFDLPEALIAHQPLQTRSDARLMVIRRDLKGSQHTIEHARVNDLPQILNQNTVMVANNTKVMRARLLGHRVLENGEIGGKIEFFLLKKEVRDEGSPAHIWNGLMKSSAKVLPGFKFKVKTLLGEVIARDETVSGTIFTAKFNQDPSLSGIGEVPLPPYIMAKRKLHEDAGPNVLSDSSHDSEEYNTVYSQVLGSVAAPTAGRHFTHELLNALKQKNIGWNEITLHVGLGTFKPVMSEDIREHHMHAEAVTITPEVANAVNEAKKNQKKILAVGTTTARTLEGMVDRAIGQVRSGSEEVNLFIHPGSGHEFKIIDAMLTNFHLPESSLFMMVAHFLGSREGLLEIYQKAIEEKYRFYSYGDAMLIL